MSVYIVSAPVQFKLNWTFSKLIKNSSFILTSTHHNLCQFYVQYDVSVKEKYQHNTQNCKMWNKNKFSFKLKFSPNAGLIVTVLRMQDCKWEKHTCDQFVDENLYMSKAKATPIIRSTNSSILRDKWREFNFKNRCVLATRETLPLSSTQFIMYASPE